MVNQPAWFQVGGWIIEPGQALEAYWIQYVFKSFPETKHSGIDLWYSNQIRVVDLDENQSHSSCLFLLKINKFTLVWDELSDWSPSKYSCSSKLRVFLEILGFMNPSSKKYFLNKAWKNGHVSNQNGSYFWKENSMNPLCLKRIPHDPIGYGRWKSSILLG